MRPLARAALFIYGRRIPPFPERRTIGKTASPAFSQLNLTMVKSPLAYFQTERDKNGLVWSGPVMTWIEAARGDARQQETAHALAQALTSFHYSTLTAFSRL